MYGIIASAITGGATIIAAIIATRRRGSGEDAR